MDQDRIIIPVRIIIKKFLTIKIARSVNKTNANASGGSNMEVDNLNQDRSSMTELNTKHHLTSVMEQKPGARTIGLSIRSMIPTAAMETCRIFHKMPGQESTRSLSNAEVMSTTLSQKSMLGRKDGLMKHLLIRIKEAMVLRISNDTKVAAGLQGTVIVEIVVEHTGKTMLIKSA